MDSRLCCKKDSTLYTVYTPSATLLNVVANACIMNIKQPCVVYIAKKQRLKQVTLVYMYVMPVLE